MKIKGKIEAFNFSPKGGYEGMLISTSNGIVQLNFSPENAAEILEAAPPGSMIVAEGSSWEDDRHGEHAVYQLETFALEGGKPVQLDRTRTVKGRVQRLNYAKHGEPNGVLLDTGDFVHLKPHGVKLVQPELGQELEAEGSARRLQFSSHWVIEADTANGVDIHDAKHHPAKKKPKK